MKLNTQTLFAALAAVTLMTPACGGDAGKKDEKKTEGRRPEGRRPEGRRPEG